MQNGSEKQGVVNNEVAPCAHTLIMYLSQATASMISSKEEGLSIRETRTVMVLTLTSSI